MIYPVKKSTGAHFEKVIDGWGIGAGHCQKWLVLFGDAEMHIVSGIYRNRRRAKKEITHYIKYGAPWCGRGTRKRIAEIQKGGAE